MSNTRNLASLLDLHLFIYNDGLVSARPRLDGKGPSSIPTTDLWAFSFSFSYMLPPGMRAFAPQ